MPERISLCGFNCGCCPAYKTNLDSEEDRARVHEGWKKFHRTRGWSYEEPHCQGCFSDPDTPPLWKSCPTRKCALMNKVENCGTCLDYPCPRIGWLSNAGKVLAERTRKEGTEEDFERFALPHQSRERLEEIHKRVLESRDTMEPQPVNTTTMPLPGSLDPGTLAGAGLGQEKAEEALEVLHTVLTNMMDLHCRTPGGREQEMKKRKEDVKVLWALGRHGELEGDPDPGIGVPLEDLASHLRFGKYKLKRMLRELAAYGVESELKEDRVRASFSRNPWATILLKHYTRLLLEEHGERAAYSRFLKADMSAYGA